MTAMTEVTERTTSSSAYTRGAFYGLAAVSIWAGNIVVAGFGLRSSLTPWDISAIRFLVAGLLLLPFLLDVGLAFDRLGWIGVAALVLGGAPTVVLANYGLLFAPAAHAGALFPGVMPLMVAMLAAVILKEPFTGQKRVGFALIVTGVVGIVWGTGGSLGTAQNFGHLLFLGSAFSWAATRWRCGGPASTGFMPLQYRPWDRCFSTCRPTPCLPEPASSTPRRAP
jgi:drug/metabolite transporter (DMT)-like permease